MPPCCDKQATAQDIGAARSASAADATRAAGATRIACAGGAGFAANVAGAAGAVGAASAACAAGAAAPAWALGRCYCTTVAYRRSRIPDMPTWHCTCTLLQASFSFAQMAPLRHHEHIMWVATIVQASAYCAWTALGSMPISAVASSAPRE